MDFARNLANRILGAVGLGRLKVVDDTGVQQRAQVQIRAGGPDGVEEIVDGVPRVGDYGFAYCPPDGSEAVVLFVGGRRSTGLIIGTGHRGSRPTGLKPGEAMLYNGLTGAFVRMSEDGKIRSKGDWLHDGDFSATGDIGDHSDDGKGQTMLASRETFNDHTHPEGTPNTGVPNQQEPE